MPVNTKNKSPIAAAILSFLINGLGQFYLGQRWKGVALFIGIVLFHFATGAVLWWLIPPIVCYDAFKIGKKINIGQTVSEWEFF